jgi:hypothetical protein
LHIPYVTQREVVVTTRRLPQAGLGKEEGRKEKEGKGRKPE